MCVNFIEAIKVRPFGHSPKSTMIYKTLINPKKRIIELEKTILEEIELKKTTFLYAFRILFGAAIAWMLLDLLHIEKKEWALISVAIVSEPDFGDLRRNTISRIINTISGCLIGIVFIVLTGVNIFSLFLAIAVAIFMGTLIKRYPSSWKLAPSTVIAVMTPAIFQQASWQDALEIALLRTSEVTLGCIVAFLVGWFFSVVKRKFNF
ncbi:hypothetical protein C5O19_06420 [Siphonobacter curvatus]|uniref:Integral membrane bound transporter domain-containing protein n=2 Tax=Siphonobacter curvatus TaxID=2094562 RepID=A0A2S7INH9_9BACT|nr:hypothetical protein C5O19_06420 [Siphonobacter curvatus]